LNWCHEGVRSGKAFGGTRAGTCFGGDFDGDFLPDIGHGVLGVISKKRRISVLIQEYIEKQEVGRG